MYGASCVERGGIRWILRLETALSCPFAASSIPPVPNNPIEPPPTMAEKHLEDSLHDDDVGRKNSILHAEVLAEPELMSGAYLAEEREHNQTLWVS